MCDFIAVYYFIMGISMNNPLFILLLMCLKCFQFLVIMIKYAVNILVHIFWWI